MNYALCEITNNSLVDDDCEEFQSGFAEVEKNPTGASSSFICPICQCIAKDTIEFPCCRRWYYCYCLWNIINSQIHVPVYFRHSHNEICIFSQGNKYSLQNDSIPLVSRQIAYQQITCLLLISMWKVWGALYSRS